MSSSFGSVCLGYDGWKISLVVPSYAPPNPAVDRKIFSPSLRFEIFCLVSCILLLMLQYISQVMVIVWVSVVNAMATRSTWNTYLDDIALLLGVCASVMTDKRSPLSYPPTLLQTSCRSEDLLPTIEIWNLWFNFLYLTTNVVVYIPSNGDSWGLEP
jgi:hypothetical protein